jgi:DNA-binding NtrC family response regulator
VDVRFVAASNQALKSAMADGRFRADLFYRLSAAHIRVPPLRDRLGDILPLAERFMAEACRDLEKPMPAFTDDVVNYLRYHTWPGNVRELKNLMAFLAATSHNDQITVSTIPPPIEYSDQYEASEDISSHPPRETAVDAPLETGFGNLKEEIQTLEKKRIKEALLATNGNRTRAAHLIGMPLRTLVTKIGRYGLSGSKERLSPP